MNYSPFVVLLVLIFVAWSFFWKILGLWNAAKHSHKGWFIALLLINTLGLLEIYYLLGVLKIKGSDLTKTFK
jgi:methionyl-tRNA synthetase